MERTQILDLMSTLKLYGMRSAYDEVMGNGIKRQHEPPRIVGDLLQSEIAEKQARSIRYQLTVAKLPLAKDVEEFDFADTPINDGLVRELASGGFIADQRNVVLVGGTGTGKTHLAIGIARALIRAGTRGRFFNVVDLVNRLEAETRAALRTTSPVSTSSSSTNSAICPSRRPEDSSSSTSSAAFTNAPRSSSPPISPSANGLPSSATPR
jgi:DNA replication protein DnaC